MPIAWQRQALASLAAAACLACAVSVGPARVQTQPSPAFDLAAAKTQYTPPATRAVQNTALAQFERRLEGYAGQELKGAILCKHLEVIEDLVSRLEERQNYVEVFKIYAEQGYCVETMVKVLLVRPVHHAPVRSWDGDAEIWEIDVVVARYDGGYIKERAYGIVFPKAMAVSRDV